MIFQRQLVQFINFHIQKRSHLVNKSSGTAGAGFVHSEVGTAGQKRQFGIFTAKLDNNIGIGNNFLDTEAGSNNFLHKRNIQFCTQGQGSRPRHTELKTVAGKLSADLADDVDNLLPHLGHMPLIS